MEPKTLDEWITTLTLLRAQHPGDMLVAADDGEKPCPYYLHLEPAEPDWPGHGPDGTFVPGGPVLLIQLKPESERYVAATPPEYN